MKKAFSSRLYFYAAYLVFAVIYLIVSLLAPLGPNRFNLTVEHTRELQAAILLPVLLIWLAAIYGAEKLYNYTRLIKNSKDGKALSVLSSGLSLLVASILINAFISLFRPWALKDGWLTAFTIFSNYTGVLLPLAAYTVLHNGSSRLLSTIKVRPSKSGWLAITLLLLMIGAGYLSAMFNYDYRVSTPDPSKFSSFYMSDILIVLTICLPYLLGWALAIKAMLNLDQYRRQVNGLIYKKSLLRLEAGLLVVIFFYIIVQLLIAFSTYFSHAGLGSILAFLYLLIFFYAIGFLVIAAGTSRLTKIERVK